jgi:predicted site-specific integrase-resolvase
MLEETQFISIKDASKITGLTQQTLRKLADNKQLDCYKTPSGQRKFNKNFLLKFTNPNNTTNIITNNSCNNTTTNNCSENVKIKQSYIYTRLSFKKNLSECCKEVELLKQNNSKYNSYIHIIEENCETSIKSSGFLTIIDACIQNTLNELVITNKTDLVHLFFDFIQALVYKSGGSLIILDDSELTIEDKEIELNKIIAFYKE